MTIKKLTPVLSFNYKGNEYPVEEVEELADVLLSEEEKHKFQRMRGISTKSAFLALATIIDLSLVRKI